MFGVFAAVVLVVPKMSVHQTVAAASATPPVPLAHAMASRVRIGGKTFTEQYVLLEH